MKTIKHILSLAILLPLMASGQTIVNGNFESWTTIPFDSYNGWSNSNIQSIPQTGKASCSKSTSAHSGNYAIELQTVTNGIDTSGAYAINTPPQNSSSNFTGGVPYTSQPTKITGYYKYTTPGNDSAGIIVVFKKAGKIISQDMFRLGPASVYTAFPSHKLSLNSQPDSVIIGMVSSYRVIGNNNYATGEIPNSTLYVDDLAFTGTGTMPPIPGGDFETGWTTTNFSTPNGWTLEGDPGTITQTTESYKGSYAIKMETLSSVYSSGISLGGRNKNGQTDGVPYTGTKDTLIGYYKYTSVGGDSGFVYVDFTKNGVNLLQTGIILPPASNYTMFSIPYSLPSTPDSIQVQIRNSISNNGTGHIGSTLIVDEVTLKSQPLHTGFELFHPIQASLSVYPNPANNLINIYPVPEIFGQGSVEICNALGKIMISKNLSEFENSNRIELSTESLKPGIYLAKEGFNGSGTFIKK